MLVWVCILDPHKPFQVLTVSAVSVAACQVLVRGEGCCPSRALNADAFLMLHHRTTTGPRYSVLYHVNASVDIRRYYIAAVKGVHALCYCKRKAQSALQH